VVERLALDRRRNAYRDDLAAESLRGRVAAPRYAVGERRRVAAGSVPLRTAPDAGAAWASEALFGESVTAYEERDGWAWVQLDADRYVGYLPADVLSAAGADPTHRVKALSTWLFPRPDIKSGPLVHVPMNAPLCVAEESDGFARLADGRFVPAAHIAGRDHFAADFPAVAEAFLGTPYLWGGKTRLGLDCSGLVQVALAAAGHPCPRDSDMQLAEVGAPVPITADLAGLRRGDLVFWPGHVGIMLDAERLLHANAHHMGVAVEALAAAVARIAGTGAAVLAVKRLADPLSPLAGRGSG
jgi:cell wall-associated NlpC family hydrolase